MAYGTVNADVIGTSVAGSNLGAGNASIMKNRIINGEFKVSQYNGTSVASAVSGYFIDRWSGLRGAGTITPVFSGQQVSDAPAGFINSVKMTVTTAGTGTYYSLLRQYIEGLNVSDLGFGTASAKTVTLSFWVKSSIAGIYAAGLQNPAGDRVYVSNYTISSANTWEQKTITIVGDTTGTWPTDNSAGILVNFDLGTSTGTVATPNTWGNTGIYTSSSIKWNSTLNATFQITGVQLEVGSSATGFEYRIYGTEFVNCQRYYQTYTQPPLRGACASSSAANRMAMILPVVMRAAPTAVVGALPLYDGVATSTVSSVASSYLFVAQVEFDFNTTSATLTTGRPASVYQTGSTSLTLSAEL